MLQQLTKMLELQNAMNTKVHDDWVAQNYEWYRAIWLECGELVEHHGYKWWKHQEPDMEQVRLEIVDIWHFGLSMLFDGRTVEQIALDMEEEIKEQELDLLSILDATETLAEKVLVTRQFKLQYFWQLLFASEMTFDELYKRYIGKNVLNFFRQDHGYKSGTYIKIWDGREDNEHLTEIQDSLDASAEDFSDQVYKALEERYPEK